MPIPTLPPEILDYITDWLAQISSSSLSDLAVSSRQFTHRSQSHLFWMMILASDTFKKRLAMLEAHPALFRYTRTLVIYMGFEPTDDNDGSDFQDTILNLLDHLPGITTLVIVFSRTYSTGEEWAAWDTISSTCRDVFTKALSAPVLEGLYVQGLRNIPIRLVQSLPCLKRLLLEKSAGFSKEGAKPGALAPPTLQWLSCHRTGIASLPPLLPSFCDIPHLSFEVAGVQEHVAVWAVLGTFPRLKSLVLNYSNRVSYSRRNRDLISDCLSESERANRTLPSFPHLRYLVIVLNAKDDLSDTACLVPMPTFVPRLLATMISQNSQPCLEVFNFRAYWTVRDDSSGSQHPNHTLLVSSEQGWSLIDNLLSNRRLFPKLRIVRSISTPYPHYTYRHDSLTIQHRAKEQTLAALQETGKIMEALDVGLDGEADMLMNDLISTMIPEQYIPDIT